MFFFVSFVIVIVVHVADGIVVAVLVIIVGPRKLTAKFGHNRVSKGRVKKKYQDPS